MAKLVLTALVGLIAGTLLSGCGNNSASADEKDILIRTQKVNYNTDIYTDKDTGLQYFIGYSARDGYGFMSLRYDYDKNTNTLKPYGK